MYSNYNPHYRPRLLTKPFFALILIFAAAYSDTSHTAGTEETPTARAAVNDLDEGRKAVKVKQWSRAVPDLEKALAAYKE